MLSASILVSMQKIYAYLCFISEGMFFYGGLIGYSLQIKPEQNK